MLPEGVNRSPLGAIHGRFQPFHNGHYRYLSLALELADIVYVGITNPDAPYLDQVEEATDSNRHRPESNPNTFAERERMVYLSAERARPGDEARLVVVPFDVNGDPTLWPDSIPLAAVQYVVPHEPWDHEKAIRFARAGYQVQKLATQQSRVTATQVRELLAREDDAWEALVPEGTAVVLKETNLLKRMQHETPPRPYVEGHR